MTCALGGTGISAVGPMALIVRSLMMMVWPSRAFAPVPSTRRTFVRAMSGPRYVATRCATVRYGSCVVDGCWAASGADARRTIAAQKDVARIKPPNPDICESTRLAVSTAGTAIQFQISHFEFRMKFRYPLIRNSVFDFEIELPLPILITYVRRR